MQIKIHFSSKNTLFSPKSNTESPKKQYRKPQEAIPKAPRSNSESPKKRHKSNFFSPPPILHLKKIESNPSQQRPLCRILCRLLPPSAVPPVRRAIPRLPCRLPLRRAPFLPLSRAPLPLLLPFLLPASGKKKRTFFCTFRNNIIPLHRLFAVYYGKKTAKGRQKDGKRTASNADRTITQP